MQTFLPESSFTDSASVLDDKRLGKQRVEAMQIYLSLTNPHYGWKHHPAVKMWRGHEGSRLWYGQIVCVEWRFRGYEDNLYRWFYERIHNSPFACRDTLPPWVGDKRFHLAHRSNLMRKDPIHYSQYYAGVPDNLPYFWPTKEADYEHHFLAA